MTQLGSGLSRAERLEAEHYAKRAKRSRRTRICASLAITLWSVSENRRTISGQRMRAAAYRLAQLAVK